MLKNEVSAINFFLLIAILIFLTVMTNNQTKCGVIYEKIAMRVCDDERTIKYEWLNKNVRGHSYYILMSLFLAFSSCNVFKMSLNMKTLLVYQYLHLLYNMSFRRSLR